MSEVIKVLILQGRAAHLKGTVVVTEKEPCSLYFSTVPFSSVLKMATFMITAAQAVHPAQEEDIRSLLELEIKRQLSGPSYPHISASALRNHAEQ